LKEVVCNEECDEQLIISVFISLLRVRAVAKRIVFVLFDPNMTMTERNTQHHPHISLRSTNAMDLALQALQPIRDLSRNWDVDIATWYDLTIYDSSVSMIKMIRM
jgi:hypothetical protein